MKLKETIFGISISVISSVIIGLTLYAYWKNDFLNFNYFLGTDKLGHFGDFIGGFLGTILTGIATYFIYKTYISQKEELEKQKEELLLNRQLIVQQQFESTFFNMLNVHRELKNSLKLKRDNCSNYKVYEGFFIKEFESIDIIEKIEVFSFLREQFKELYFYRGIEAGNLQNKTLDNLYKDLHVKNEREKIIYLNQKLFFKKYQNVISHYCRNIYQILKYIRENEKQETLGKKRTAYLKYTDIFQSQLNEDEQFLLFYNFIVFEDKNKKEFSTINLVNHYQFLENLGHENLLNNEKHNNKNFYNFDIK
jgi:hypothetical protein